MLFDPDFVPFRPPPQPLGLRGLPTIWRNYIETIPQAAYEQGITHVRTRYSDVLLVCEPDVIGEILVERANAFGRDPATRRSFKPVVGENSIFVAEGAEWRWQRRAAAPIFRHETILSFVPVGRRARTGGCDQKRFLFARELAGRARARLFAESGF